MCVKESRNRREFVSVIYMKLCIPMLSFIPQSTVHIQNVSVKIRFALEQAVKTQSGSNYIVLLFL